MPRASDAKSRLIRTAIHLFRRRGYHGVGLTELLAASEAPKGSFYHHFPGGKEALAVAAVEEAGAGIATLLEAAFADAPDMDSGAERVARMLADGFAASDYSAGCPVTAVLLDTVPGSDPLAAAGARVLESWQAIVAHHAARLDDPRDAKALGLALFTALQGGWILARLQRRRAPLLLAGRALRMVEARRGDI